MGCILSYIKSNNEERNPPLLTNYCFVCGKTFTDNIKYNKHIPRCNMNTLNKK